MQVPGSATVVMQPAFALSGTQTVGAGGDGYAVGDILIPTSSSDITVSTSTSTSTSTPTYTTSTEILTNTSTTSTSTTITSGTSTSVSVDALGVTTNTSTSISTSTTIYRPGTTATGASSATIKVLTITGTGTRGPIGTVDVNGPGPYKVLPTSPMAMTPLTGTGTGAKITPKWNPVNPGAYPSPVLSFTVQPSNASQNTNISPAVEVSAVGNLSLPVENYTGDISLAIGNNAGSPAGTLSGTTTQTAVAGVATFSDLQIDQIGTGYTLVTSADNLVNVTSTPFNIGKAIGGTITTSGAYTIHTFTADGTFTTLVDNLEVDYLIVGGGGGRYAGGGGGGGLSYVTSYDMGVAGANAVTVGLAGTSGSNNTNGGDTTFITTVSGGGKGGGIDNPVNGSNGGCGGGGGWPDPGGTSTGGTGNIGYAGGTGETDVVTGATEGGGGGGMGAIGTNGHAAVPRLSGSGGIGVSNAISGATVWYSGGGAGDSSKNGTNGQGYDGPGGGGGAAGSFTVAKDGIVIVRYLT